MPELPSGRGRPDAAARASRPLRVHHVAAEGLPFSKTGGLADVVGALPPALAGLGLEVTVVLPAHPALEGAPATRASGRAVEAELGSGRRARFRVLEAEAGGVRTCLLDEPALFGRRGLYADAEGRDWPDNALRFAAFAAAAARLAEEDGADLVHGHDWQAGLVPAYARVRASRGGGTPSFRTLLTIHNLAYQGVFPAGVWPALGLPDEWFGPEGAEFYGQVGFLKAGLVLADALSTVSPTYAREILTPEHGAGLEGALRARADPPRGILNGIDVRRWDPGSDPVIARPFGLDELDGKRACKAALQTEMGLAPDPRAPLAGVISRLAEQKGWDLLLAVLPGFLDRGLQVAALGAGDPRYERALRELERRHPGRAAARIGVDLELAHRIEAGADLFLMPSRYEPCGLNQMYSMRYGTVPVVRSTGGLADTVVDAAEGGRGTGYRFDAYAPQALAEALARALADFGTPRWVELQRRGMERDFSWAGPARQYLDVYRSLRPRAAAHAGAIP